MSVFTFCGTDPLLKYIRNVYGAHPLMMPDSQIEPLTLITVVDKTHRYMGTIADSIMSPPWHPPILSHIDLPDLEFQDSQTVSLKTALGILAPFLTMTLGISVAFDLQALATTRVSLSLGGTRKEYTSPMALYGALHGQRLHQPLPTDKAWRLYAVDGVLTARRVTITNKSSREVDIGKVLTDQLPGALSSDALLGGRSSITLKGTDALFAFTCLALDIHPGSGELSTLTPSSRRALAFVGECPDGEEFRHAAVGEDNEFIAFD